MPDLNLPPSYPGDLLDAYLERGSNLRRTV